MSRREIAMAKHFKIEMISYSGILHASLLSCMLLLWIATTSAVARGKKVESIKFTIANNGLQVRYGDEVRLSKGAPGIQGENLGTTFWSQVGNHDFKFHFGDGKTLGVKVKMMVHKNVAGLFLISDGNKPPGGADYLGFFFGSFPGYEQGISYWFMQYWNPWTKPMQVDKIADFPNHGVQFYLWQYDDGTYGAAMPLGGEGYEVSLGKSGGGVGAKAVSGYDGTRAAEVPMFAVGFGKDPYALVNELYKDGLSMIGRKEDLRINKKYPEILDYFGWCSWNASDNGRALSDTLLVDAAKSFREHDFPLSWIIIDDGWLQNDHGALTSYEPNPSRFPGGFKPVIEKLKGDYGIRSVGVWHTIDGYWSGIDINSPIGRRYRKSIFSWTVMNNEGAATKFYFISPYSHSLGEFYDNWYKYLSGQGVDFVKVDNQLSIPVMAKGNYPVFGFAARIHKQLNKAVNEYFHDTMINCMDMGSNAYYNFGRTAVARASEDYFPYHPGQSYSMTSGNDAVHVLSAVSNSLWFGEMVYPDYDEFESNTPTSVYEAIAHAISDGPVYVTDKPGEQRFNVLSPFVYRDGKIIRTSVPARPTEDCLFQVQDPRPFKAFSRDGNIGVLAIWNVADTDMVSGEFKPSDVYGISGEDFLVYNYFSKTHIVVRKDQAIPVKLGRLGYELYFVSPIKDGFAPIGLVDKYNAPGTIDSYRRRGNIVTIRVGESGPFAAYSSRRPESVKVNSSVVPFDYSDDIISLNMGMRIKNPVIEIIF